MQKEFLMSCMTELNPTQETEEDRVLFIYSCIMGAAIHYRVTPQVPSTHSFVDSLVVLLQTFLLLSVAPHLCAATQLLFHTFLLLHTFLLHTILATPYCHPAFPHLFLLLHNPSCCSTPYLHISALLWAAAALTELFGIGS